jgi:hypothetical protein
MARRMKCIGLQKKLPVANVPSHKLDDLLARVAERLAYLVEDAGSLRFLGFAVGAAFFTDIFES